MTSPETVANRETSQLQQLLAIYRETGRLLERDREQLFPRGCVVRVEHNRFTGLGLVAYSEDCPLDQLPVLLESGNIWWYELETCQRVRDPGLWSIWIRQHKLPGAVITGKPRRA